MQQFYAAVGTGDKDKAASLMADDVRWMEAENFPLADRNPYVGAQAVLEGVFARLGDVLDDFGVDLDFDVLLVVVGRRAIPG